ncbi:MAG: hypothetical protein A2233_02370 [Candidatus Kerfeldbacteria bacterium RIFOXYA2_FULL_38_24]|uniref:Uncharacterized protein n=1 Tax=Candidatus Kerfeldbacteria bacterium RIFOXYB2_FULL_38_14 TaxID=1798547 RepID=A0A1G2BF27_9BACT|nr:MAG: hypothetical protein A2319_04970 [Candidatus Kerfeldbacteria bacterium RIFOXYB2_FULL_38_14]OGY87954.1 MAG: hypothetical protein A2233_02370 [Candidatus Kerfeldbacteria bacterium RIFOXYA2_FULL_38_24]OGY88635.1 MAG: hypothetical protein A2458_03235 [Candidatus Kerfeldbacteria bacterium RIFOXYC2_FULL_38_9]
MKNEYTFFQAPEGGCKERKQQEDATSIENESSFEKYEQTHHKMAVLNLYFERFLQSDVHHAESIKQATDFSQSAPWRAEIENRFYNLARNIFDIDLKNDEALYKMYRASLIAYQLSEISANRQRLYLKEKKGIDLCQSTPEENGKRLFEIHTGRKPSGTIRISQQEGYFLCICEKDKDYIAMRKGHNDATNVLPAGGSYHRTFMLDVVGGIKLRLLLINACDEVVESNWEKRVVVHEKAHLLHDRLYGIDRSGSFLPEHLPEYKRLFDMQEYMEYGDNLDLCNPLFRPIKDELLAYIRDGSGAERIKASLFSPLYDHLFQACGNEQKSARDYVEAVVKAFSIAEKMFSTQDFSNFGTTHFEKFVEGNRAVLANRLSRVPLEAMSFVMAEAVIFYKKREEKLRQAAQPTDIDFDIVLEYEWEDHSIASKNFSKLFRAAQHYCTRVINNHISDPRSTQAIIDDIEQKIVAYKKAQRKLPRLTE